MKKDTLVMIGNVVLLAVLIILIVVEIKNPQGGAELLGRVLGAK